MKYSRADIAKAFVTQADKQGVKRATKDLAALLLDQRIQGETDEIIAAIAAEYARTHGVVESTGKSAYPLSADLKKQLEERVKRSTGAQKVVLHEEIDSSLLGGAIVTAPGMELDLSLKSKLTRLKI